MAVFELIHRVLFFTRHLFAAIRFPFRFTSRFARTSDVSAISFWSLLVDFLEPLTLVCLLFKLVASGGSVTSLSSASCAVIPALMQFNSDTALSGGAERDLSLGANSSVSSGFIVLCCAQGSQDVGGLKPT